MRELNPNPHPNPKPNPSPDHNPNPTLNASVDCSFRNLIYTQGFAVLIGEHKRIRCNQSEAPERRVGFKNLRESKWYSGVPEGPALENLSVERKGERGGWAGGETVGSQLGGNVFFFFPPPFSSWADLFFTKRTSGLECECLQCACVMVCEPRIPWVAGGRGGGGGTPAPGRGPLGPGALCCGGISSQGSGRGGRRAPGGYP